MKRRTILLSLGLVLLCAGLAFAGDGPRFFGKLKAAIPVATAVFGFAGGVLALMPKIVAVQKAIQKAKDETDRVRKKYKRVLQPDIANDFKRLWKTYDDATERVADLLKVLRMKKAERALRRLL